MSPKNLKKARLRECGAAWICDAIWTIGPTISSSPSLGNLPTDFGSLSVGILLRGAGSEGEVGSSSTPMAWAREVAKSWFSFHRESISAHFCSV
jgi:hypothetical protein